MDIVMITRRFPPAPGGVEKQVREISSQLARRGHHLKVYTSDLYSDVPLQRLSATALPETDSSVEVHRYMAIPVPWRGRQGTTFTPSMLLQLVGGETQTLIHAHGLNLVTLSALLVDLKPRRKVIFTTHSDPGRLDGNLVSLVLQKCDGVVALTEIERRRLLSLGVEKTKIALIPNGINLAAFAELPPKSVFRTRFGVKGKMVLYAGRIDAAKGCDVLIEAATLAQPKIGECTVVLAGPDWGAQKQLERIAQHSGVRTVFTGNLSLTDLKSALVSCDVFVQPSIEEAFGVSILEAMICGAPVVATRVGGVPAVVSDNGNGLLVNPRNARELENAITRIITDATLSQRLTKNARRFASQFSIQKTVAQLESFYQDIISYS